MSPLAAVAVGGAIGALARYVVSLLCLKLLGACFPWGTLCVNVLGGFAMGVLFAAAAHDRGLTLFLGTGVLGGFTTFSAFGLETLLMIERGAILLALAYALASVAFALLATLAGIWVARSFG